MQDQYIDDEFVRKPGGPRPDYDRALADFKRDFEDTPDEVHAEHEAVALGKLQEVADKPAAREVFADKNVAIVVDDPQDIQKIHDAEARDAAAKAAEEATQQATQQATAENPSATPGTSSDNKTDGSSGSGSSAPDAQKKPDAEKPSELEEILANIRMTGDRQRRLVISGDPAIHAAFYNKLAARKQCYFSSNGPVITLSRDKALKVLQETVAEFNGATFNHALAVKLDREGGGIRGSIAASIANNLPGFLSRRHEIDVVVVGREAVVENKLKELGALVTDMERNHIIAEGKAQVLNGKMVLSEKGPVELDGTSDMYNLMRVVQTKVIDYQSQQSARQQELREHREQKDFKSMTDSKEKAEKDTDGSKPERVNKHAADLAEKLDLGFQDSNLLHIKNGKGQVEAVALLQQSRGLKDPTERELQTLPDADRQKAIVQMAALVEKIDNKEFGAKVSAELDKHKADTSSIRQKVTDYVAMEAARDTDFGAKAEALLKDLVERKVISEEQAGAITGRIAEAVTAAKEAAAAAAPAQESTQAPADGKDAVVPDANASPNAGTGADASQTPAGEKEGVTAQATDLANEGAQSQAVGAIEKAAEAGDSTANDANARSGNEDVPAKDTSQIAEGTKEAAAPDVNAGASGDGAVGDAQEPVVKQADSAVESGQAGADAAPAAADKVSEKESNKSGQGDLFVSDEEKSSRTTSASDLAAQGSVPADAPKVPEPSAAAPIEQPTADAASKDAASLPLRERIAALAADGPEKLTVEKAHVLVAELDAIRTKPLSALDAEAGDKPTQTLVRVGALLEKMEKGGLGSEVKAMAKDLNEPLQRWAEQDAARYGATADAALKWADAVTRAKVADIAWQGAPDGAKQESGKAAEPTSTGTPSATPERAPTEVAPEVKLQPTRPSPEQLAREQAATRLVETESAAGKVAMLMANPAGSFTNRDKTWNEENIQRVAKDVLRLDPDSVSQMSSAQRTKVAVYAAWVAENASTGKLPGFNTAEGKAVASQLVTRAAELIGKMDQDAKVPSEVQKALDKADRMTNAKEELQKTSSFDTEASRVSSKRGSVSPAAAQALANDVVHTVYSPKDASEAQVKYLLKSAANLTPDAVKDMSVADRAKTAVALEHLAQQVRAGAMGEFSKLPSSVQKNVVAAGQAASKLMSSLDTDPAARSELNNAYNALHSKDAGVSQDGVSSSTSKSQGQAKSGRPAHTETPAATTSKLEGRDLDR